MSRIVHVADLSLRVCPVFFYLGSLVEEAHHYFYTFLECISIISKPSLVSSFQQGSASDFSVSGSLSQTPDLAGVEP